MISSQHRRATLSWIFVAGLFLLCAFLGVLQYRWIGEVSAAARDRLHGTLEASLVRLSIDFNTEISNACRALIPPAAADSPGETESGLAARFSQWKKSGHRIQLFRRIALATPHNGSLALRLLNFDRDVFETAAWPPEWQPVRERMEGMFSAEPRGRRGFRGPPSEELPFLFDIPVFPMDPPGRPGFSFAETPTILFDLSPEYAREVLLPELVQRHLEAGGSLEYQVEVLTRQRTPAVVYQSDPEAQVSAHPDASVGLFDPPYEQILRRAPPPGAAGRDRGPGAGGRGRGGIPAPDSGHWQMFVRHRTGSLETVVAHARFRNLAVTAGVLLLMMASVGALITYTRRAQRLADLQMEFVAGISHELRTPLTVIHTAAYNLRGKLAANPTQVERYGVLIQRESGRLRDLVEQVLRFSGAAAGHVIQSPEPVSIADLLEDTLATAATVLQQAGCTVEKHLPPELPLVLGDSMALKQAFLNLLHNAAKYGAGDNPWVGVSATAGGTQAKPTVEIRVADHGPGIPPDEQSQVFEPFFRGRHALQDQIHGTGLGLNLARKIFEAHGGSILVKSVVPSGAEFVVRLPAAPAGDPS